MNKLHIGFTSNVSPPKSGYLLLSDTVPELSRARVFDPAEHSFNPLHNLDYKRARNITEILYAVFPQGENTLTVRNGKRDMLKALLSASRLDLVKGNEEVNGVIQDVLASPVLSGVLCSRTNFSFKPTSSIVAKIDRASLGEFDSLVLGLFLIEQFAGQLVIPDFGFYGRDMHSNLIRQNRLIAGVNFLGELPEKLRRASLLIKDKEASGATHEDALVLARYAGLRPDPLRDDNPFNRFIDEAMS